LYLILKKSHWNKQGSFRLILKICSFEIDKQKIQDTLGYDENTRLNKGITRQKGG